MIDQIRSEWLKLRTVRSNVVMLLVAVALGAGIAGLTAGFTRERIDIGQALGGLQLASVLFTIVGVQMIGQEYRFNTIRVTLAQSPGRTRVLAAKTLVAGAVALVSAALLVGLALAVAGLVGAASGRPINLSTPGTTQVILGTILLGALSAWFGLAVGTLVRQPIAAIVICFVWGVVEAFIAGIWGASARWLPLSGANNLTALEPDPELLGRASAGTYQAVVMLCLLVVAAWRMNHSDA